MEITVSQLSPWSFMPVRGSSGAAGHDLFVAYQVEIKPQSFCEVIFDLKIQFPADVYGRLAVRYL